MDDDLGAATTALRPVGRPRDERLTARILLAAQRELAASGVEQFSVRGVARRAEVSRKTITTRWPAVEDLLLDAIGATRPVRAGVSGSLHADLLTIGRLIVRGLSGAQLEVQLRVTADAIEHPYAFEQLQRGALGSARAAVIAVLVAGQAGDRDPVALEWLADSFVGSLFLRTMQNPGRRPPSQAELSEFVEQFVRWAGA